MLINRLKSGLKLVVMRPHNYHYFRLYSPELLQLQIKPKPGLIPPFYSDIPTTLDEVQANEIHFLIARLKNYTPSGDTFGKQYGILWLKNMIK